MDYRVLGPLEIRDGERSLPLAGAKQRALLALLLVNANHVVSRDRLIDGLWGEQPPETAVTSLHVYVSRLRKLLASNALLTRPPGYLLEIDSDELDLRRFERLLIEGREALADGDPARAAYVLHDALALWRGPALAEFAFEPFAQAEIGRLEDLRLAAVEERIEADLALGRHAELIGELDALITENPHRERLRGQLMLALYRSGRQAEALDAYQGARHALVDELGIEPSAHLQRLERQILTQDEALETTRTNAAAVSRASPPVERKRVTVLFADLGMTDDEEADPEEAGALLDRIHEQAAAEIEAAGGTVEKGLAGALLATFGVEAARHDDHAVRAVSAALATRKRLANTFGDALSFRIGVASGEVILGRPGSFVTGAPVGSAARLVRLAQPGEVVVGERTATAAAGAFELEQRDGAYALVGALAPKRSPAQIARRRKWRRLAALTGTVIASAAITLVAVYATRPAGITVPPNSVGVIDPKTNEVVGHVPVGSQPGRVVAGAHGVWVANLDDETLSRIDPKTRKVVKTILLDGTPTDLAVGVDSVWVAYGFTGALAQVAPQFNSLSEPTYLPVNTQVGGLRGSVAFGVGSVWAVYGDSSVFRIDPASMRILAHLFAGYAPSAIAFDKDSLWVANWEAANVMRFDASTNGVLRTFGAGNRPNGVAVGDGAVWVTDTADNAVARIDPDVSGYTTTPVGRAPMGITYGADSVWVANSGEGTVSRIDPRTREVVATVRVGNSPWGIAVSDDGMVWVSVRST